VSAARRSAGLLRSFALAVVAAVVVGAAPSGAEPERSFGWLLAEAARAQVSVTLHYDPAYVRLAYPGGDVPIERGVCSDVLIRAFRKRGVDLQRLVHEDMRANFASYPQNWGLRGPDSNIDHRRVLNLQKLFERRGLARPITRDPADYWVGDIVAYMLPGELPHIGIVSERRSPDGQRPLLIHNIGAGAQIEDVLFAYRIAGHYRWE
jgi:uncharacterized protein YijF (DUF1287 family)